jgi:hypothetical protein
MLVVQIAVAEVSWLVSESRLVLSRACVCSCPLTSVVPHSDMTPLIRIQLADRSLFAIDVTLVGTRLFYK